MRYSPREAWQMPQQQWALDGRSGVWQPPHAFGQNMKWMEARPDSALSEGEDLGECHGGGGGRGHGPGGRGQDLNFDIGPPSDYIADETLAQLTVKELNKRVQNLSRDEIVKLKQRRRTLKNRG